MKIVALTISLTILWLETSIAQTAAVEKNDRISRSSSSSRKIQDAQLTAMALAFLGYFDPKNTNQDRGGLSLAMKEFQRKHNLPQSGRMSWESQLALSRAVSSKKPKTESSLKLAELLLDSGERLITSKRRSARPSFSIQSNVIESQIDGDFDGWDGETIVKLTNGQIWQQTDFEFHYHYAFMPDVIIVNSSSGYKMIVDGVLKAIEVTRLK